MRLCENPVNAYIFHILIHMHTPDAMKLWCLLTFSSYISVAKAIYRIIVIKCDALYMTQLLILINSLEITFYFYFSQNNFSTFFYLFDTFSISMR